MKKEIVDIEGVAPPSAPFNHIVKANGFLFFSSQLSTDLKTNKIIPGDMRAMVEDQQHRVAAALEQFSVLAFAGPQRGRLLLDAGLQIGGVAVQVLAGGPVNVTHQFGRIAELLHVGADSQVDRRLG